jgi:hypothetical protein
MANRFFFAAAITGQAIGAGANPLATLVDTGFMTASHVSDRERPLFTAPGPEQEYRAA